MRSIARLLPLSLLALPFIACSSDKNHAERDDAAKHDPSYAVIDYNDEASMKAACVGQCRPDPGPRAVDMVKAQQGYDFVWTWDFVGETVAKATYTYDDNTTDFVVPLRTDAMTGTGRGGWEPHPDMVPWTNGGPTLAVRFKGGPFTEYGGGFGQSLLTTANPGDRPTLMALKDSLSSVYTGFPSGGAYDLRAWDGVAIWVRRGPDGQSTMRVGITERNSAEDLNSGALEIMQTPGVRENQYCKRWRLCGCSGTTTCNEVMVGSDLEMRCFDKSIDPNPSLTALESKIDYPTCGTWRCKEFNTSTTAADPLFADKSCSLAVTSDGHSDSYCYNPGTDPTPPSKRERCNNPFSRAFTVTTDWQLIKIPFTELRQADEAQVAPEMDLSAVKQLVVTFGGGWIDFWVANIGFYRKQ